MSLWLVFMLGKAFGCWFYWKWACHAQALIPVKSTTLRLYHTHIGNQEYICPEIIQMVSRFMLVKFWHFFLYDIIELLDVNFLPSYLSYIYQVISSYINNMVKKIVLHAHTFELWDMLSMFVQISLVKFNGKYFNCEMMALCTCMCIHFKVR